MLDAKKEVDHGISEMKKNLDEELGLDFDDDGWLRPKPEHVWEFMKNWQGCLKDMTEDDFNRMKYEQIMGESE
jgi:hypothetical protein